MTESISPTELRLEALLDALASDTTPVASGALAAMVAASAAGLATMAARRSSGWSAGAAAAGQADVLRRRATALIDASAQAYGRALAELDLVSRSDGASGARRDWELGEALRGAADAPLAVAEVASDVAALAATIADECGGAQGADAVASCLLAESAVAVAAHLVAVNLTAAADDPRVERVEMLRSQARAVRARLESPGPG